MSFAGLTTVEAQARITTFGRNELPSRERRTLLQHVGSVLREPMIALLIAAAALYVSFGDAAEAAALGVSVLVIVGITLLQERRSARALAAVRELASPHARVLRERRDGHLVGRPSVRYRPGGRIARPHWWILDQEGAV